MLSKSDLGKAVQAMLQAERDAKPCVQLTTTYPDITIEDAYAVQREVIAVKLAAGRRVLGHKIGLTSKAMQSASGVSDLRR